MNGALRCALHCRGAGLHDSASVAEVGIEASYWNVDAVCGVRKRCDNRER